MRRAAKVDSVQQEIVDGLRRCGLHKNGRNLVGTRVGKVVVLRLLPGRYHHYPTWLCACDCGGSKVFPSNYLRRRAREKASISCGCARFTTSISRLCEACSAPFVARWRVRDGRHEKCCSAACAVKVRDFNGEKNPNWDDNATIRNLGGRFTYKYKKWREAVLGRDKHSCVQCGSREKLHCDHIKPWKYFPDLRYEISNGRTLCAECHWKTPTWGRRHAASQ